MKRVLFVEDEESLRRVYKENFEEEGYEVLLAANGQEALSLIDPPAQLPDLIVMDIRMPEMDGITLLKAAWKSSPTFWALS